MWWYNIGTGKPSAIRYLAMLMSDARQTGCRTKSSTISALCGAQSWLYVHISGDNDAGHAERLVGHRIGKAEPFRGSLVGFS